MSNTVPPQINPHELLIQGVVDYAIYMLDPQGYVASWNPGAEKAKGYTSKEIIGEHFSRFYTEEDRAADVPETALKTAVETGRFTAEGWRVRKGGARFWAMVVIDAIRNEQGELIGFAKITRDMSERREQQVRLEESREQLFRSQKMEALGQLTGGLAHDFNNLLTAIMGAAELGLRQAGDPEKARSRFEVIRTSAQRGGSLTKQLLAFARAQPLLMQALNVNSCVESVLALLRPSLPANIELITALPDSLTKASADAGQLELALLNLAFNARDAMRSGGTLRIAAQNVILNGTPDELTGNHVAITVSDTGAGIAPDALHKVFDPFFTTKRFGQGTGLGLSQVFGFAKQVGGAITVESRLGRGATFTLYLPVGGAAKLANAPDQEPAVSSFGTILVVEDDEAVAELASALLQEMGFRAIVVHSGREALDELSHGDRPQLVFSDIIMPGGISGLELAGTIRIRFPELPILLTTGYSEQVGGSHGFPVLPKPYAFDGLMEAVAGLLKHRDPSIS